MAETLANAKDCCENCLYCWQYEEQYSFFQCRYNPPVRVITDSARPDLIGVFPSVPLDWWCGKYRPSAEKVADEKRQEEERWPAEFHRLFPFYKKKDTNDRNQS